jgi:hypothetical protein
MEDAFEKIKCDAYDKSIDLSENFWDYYKELKDIYDKKTISTNPRDNDPERKALNTINSLINSKNYRFQQYHIDFLKMLKEDIIDYGTLPTKTLRRIAAMNCKSENNIQKTINEIESLIREMGSNYLEIEKKRLQSFNKEIIIAIENQKL